MRRNSMEMQTHDEDDDQSLPLHIRRSGRIESLQEFQQRALSYDIPEAVPVEAPEATPYMLHTNTTPLEAIFRDNRENENLDNQEPTRRATLQRSSIQTLDEQSLYYSENGDRSRLYTNRSSRASRMGFRGVRSKRPKHFYRYNAELFSFLILLGVIGGPMNFVIRAIAEAIKLLRNSLVNSVESETLKYLVWTMHTLIFTHIGLFWTNIGATAAGSGISQIKSILTGIDPHLYLPGYFTINTLVAKIGGLIFAVGAGLLIGTEGAYVHIMAITTHQLLRLPMFSGFASSLNARLQLLAAACAVGVSSTFASPISGVLFSLEVTATYYLVSNYLKAFVAAIAASVMIYLPTSFIKHEESAEINQLLIPTNITKTSTIGIFEEFLLFKRTSALSSVGFPTEFNQWELPLFLVLGFIIGCLATYMLTMIRIIANKRKELRQSDSKWTLFFVDKIDPSIVAVLTASFTFFPGQFARISTNKVLSLLFSSKELTDMWQESENNRTITLISLTVIYVVLIPLTFTLKLPYGVWFPSFIAGAALGRVFGYALSLVFNGIMPGTYALAAAAAFAGASTRTVSAAVITLEITGAIQLMLPIFITVLSAIATMNSFRVQSVYDTVLMISGLPYMPLLNFSPSLTAGDIAESNVVFLCKKTTVARIMLAMQRAPEQDIPVVQSEETMTMLGIVSSSQLRKFVRHYYKIHRISHVEEDLRAQRHQVNNQRTDRTADCSSGSNRGRVCISDDNFGRSELPLANFDEIGGLNGQITYDQIYTVLSMNRLGDNTNAVPFLMNDERMLSLMSQGWDDHKRQQLLVNEIKITSYKICDILPISITMSTATSVDDIHMIFTMLRLDHCFLVDKGELVGVVTTKSLLNAGNYKCE